MSKITIPDLRFEESFMRQINSYAGREPPAPSKVQGLSDEELKLINNDIDILETNELEMTPIAPITPGIIIYAILKDQILMPLLQGFAWTGFLLSIRPIASVLIAQGQHTGIWVSNLLGLNKLHRK